MSNNRHVTLAFFALVILANLALSGCGSGAADVHEHDLEMAPLAMLPSEVQEAPISVQQAYQFAVANPDILKQIPCYCGCGAVGHPSNYACYVAEDGRDGSTTTDWHALGCSICVDITQDTMRLLRQGKSVEEIRVYVDTTYARFGPSNMP